MSRIFAGKDTAKNRVVVRFPAPVPVCFPLVGHPPPVDDRRDERARSWNLPRKANYVSGLVRARAPRWIVGAPDPVYQNHDAEVWGHRMNRSAAVAAELGLRLVVPERDGVPLTASLRYRCDDPYAIRMSFHIGMDDPVEWLFARDLLAVGMQTPVGDGDVRVWPAPPGDRDVLNISLSSPFGQAHFEASLTAVTGFLRRTYEVVPLGRESDFIDLEGELRDLNRSA
jgi:hypothetical protein